AGLLEQFQMARDRRLGDTEIPARLAHSGGAGAEPFDDLATHRMCQCSENIVSHSANYTAECATETTKEDSMTEHAVTTREDWDAARADLLKREKQLTRLNEELAAERRALPWLAMDKQYRFETEAGTRTLVELFEGRSQLAIYNFMFGPEYEAGCPVCSSIADSFDGVLAHLAARDVTMICVSRAPIEKLLAYRGRMGGRFDWAL